MKKITTFVLSGIFFLQGIMFYNHYTYAHHVDQAKNSLRQLEDLLSNGTSNSLLGASVLNTFEAKDVFGDIRLKHLTNKIINSTKYAIENADELTKVSKLKSAINEISELQVKEVKLIHTAMKSIENEVINQEVKHSYNIAVDLKNKVTEASKEIQKAIDENQELIKIDIKTSKDVNSHDSGH